MDLRINRAHARLGERGEAESCPTAVALNCIGFGRVEVDGEQAIIFSEDGEREYFDLPNTLQKAIEKYDNGKPFKVGTYRIKGLPRPKHKG
jgi:hypothetical protein